MTANSDTMLILAGTWRVVEGQLPHVDFSSHLGAAVFWLCFLGVKIHGLSATSLDYGITVVFIVIAPLAYVMCRKYFGTLHAMLSFVLVASFLITPRMFNYGPSSISYTGFYNLIGYAIFFIVTLVLIQRSDRLTKSANLTQGSAIGMLWSFAVLLKITFGVAIGAVVIYSSIKRIKNNFFWKGMLIGILIPACFVLYLYRISVFSIIADWQIVSEIGRRKGVFSLNSFLNVLSSCWIDFTAIAATTFLSLTFWRQNVDKGEDRFLLFRSMFFQLLLLSIGIFLTLTINQPPEFALTSFLALCWFFLVFRTKAFKGEKFGKTRAALLFLIGMWFYGNMLYKNYLGIWLIYNDSRFLTGENPNGLKSEVLSDLGTGYPFTELYNEGIDLLDGAKIGSHLMVVDYADIFSLILNVEPPKNIPIIWEYRMTYDEQSIAKRPYYSADNVFRFVDTLLIPAEQGVVDKNHPFLLTYREYIFKNFDLLRASPRWAVYIRKSS